MYLLHLWHAVDDVQSARRHEARAHAAARAAAPPARAPDAEPGALRRAVAFVLIEAGLRLLTPRPAPGDRRAR